MSEKEYIERGALLMTPPFTKYGGDLSKYTEGYLDCAEEARNAVNDAPAADVVEVRHGEWIAHDDDWCGAYYTCSACGCDWTTIDGTPQENNMKYCPECGARMDGERKDKP